MKHMFFFIFAFGFTINIFGQNVNMVIDLRIGESGSAVNNLFVFNDNLYFTAKASSYTGSYPLWVYDGENQPIKFLYDGFQSWENNRFCIFNNKFFFERDEELWSYDGLNNPEKETNIIDGIGASDLIVYHDTLFFSSIIYSPNGIGHRLYIYDGLNDAEAFCDYGQSLIITKALIYDDAIYIASQQNGLWCYENDTLVKVFETNHYFNSLIVFNNELFFNAETNSGQELWKYNSGTNVFHCFDIDPDSTLQYDPISNTYFYEQNSSMPDDFCVYKDTLFFTARTNTTSFQRKMWYYTGYDEPQIANQISENKFEFSNLKVFNNSIFFSCNDSIHGKELWVYDGNATNLVSDICVGIGGGSQPLKFTQYHNQLYFTADDHLNYGRELWVYDPFLNSVKQVIQKNDIIVFPNPTNGIINFEFANSNVQKLIISNITGKQIIEKTELQHNETIDLSSFKSGVYIVSIQTNKDLIIKKIVKE